MQPTYANIATGRMPKQRNYCISCLDGLPIDLSTYRHWSQCNQHMPILHTQECQNNGITVCPVSMDYQSTFQLIDTDHNATNISQYCIRKNAKTTFQFIDTDQNATNISQYCIRKNAKTTFQLIDTDHNATSISQYCIRKNAKTTELLYVLSRWTTNRPFNL
jgi:hypothetical protein